MTGKPPQTQSRTPVKRSPRAVKWWYGLMALGGFAFGLIGERRPFGSEVIAHPFVVFAIATCGALLLLRVVLKRPVPEVIPDRSLLLGCFVGLAMFLAGNFVAAHVGVAPF
jgi:drug/metabolite transporter (DMT)-like permease